MRIKTLQEQERSVTSQKLTFVKLWDWFGIFRKSKMKGAHLIKISPLVQIGGEI